MVGDTEPNTARARANPLRALPQSAGMRWAHVNFEIQVATGKGSLQSPGQHADAHIVHHTQSASRARSRAPRAHPADEHAMDQFYLRNISFTTKGSLGSPGQHGCF